MGRPDIGLFIGLGGGFVLAGLFREGINTSGRSWSGSGHRGILILLGILLIVAGIGVVTFPAYVWQYLGAAVLIVLGIWFFFRGIRRSTNP